MTCKIVKRNVKIRTPKTLKLTQISVDCVRLISSLRTARKNEKYAHLCAQMYHPVSFNDIALLKKYCRIFFLIRKLISKIIPVTMYRIVGLILKKASLSK